MEVNLFDLKEIYEKEVRPHTKNKQKLFYFERNKMMYLNDIKKMLEEGTYSGGKYNIFLINIPKKRVIMSQGIYDKIVNHYVTRFILFPKLEHWLIPENCATRKDMGLSYAVELMKKDINYYKRRYDNFYFIKLDIRKFFYSIDQEVLLELLRKDLDDEEYTLVKSIVLSTNKPYVNKKIKELIKKCGEDLPLYLPNKGLPIGNMTSQFLAVFYLYKLQWYIRHNLHLKFIAYMDDYIIFHEDKEYLKKCLEIIKQKLKDEYKLEVSKKKTYIASIKRGIPFIGYIFYLDDKRRTKIKLTQNSKRMIKKGIKRAKYNFSIGKITFAQLFASIENYKHAHPCVTDYSVQNIIERYWEK